MDSREVEIFGNWDKYSISTGHDCPKLNCLLVFIISDTFIEYVKKYYYVC